MKCEFWLVLQGRTQSVRRSSASVGPRQPEVPESAPEQRPHVQSSTTRNGQNGRPGRDTQATGPQDPPMNVGNSPRPSKRRHVDSNGNGATGSDEPAHAAEPVQMSIDAQVFDVSAQPGPA